MDWKEMIPLKWKISQTLISVGQIDMLMPEEIMGVLMYL